MKEDIKSRSDLEVLVLTFYERIRQDDHLSPFFLEVVHVDWDKHLPIMVDFWEHVLFHTGSYKGNPIQKHLRLSKIKQIEEADFFRWLELWEDTVNALYSGEMTETVKRKAKDIARMMQIKLAADFGDTGPIVAS